jgi:hypothetical protein
MINYIFWIFFLESDNFVLIGTIGADMPNDPKVWMRESIRDTIDEYIDSFFFYEPRSEKYMNRRFSGHDDFYAYRARVQHREIMKVILLRIRMYAGRNS